MAVIYSEAMKYHTKIGQYSTKVIRRSLNILLERFHYSKGGIETEDLSTHYLGMEVDCKVAIYLRIWLHLNENMEIFRKFYKKSLLFEYFNEINFYETKK